jgi:serine/threonine-protein kinase
MASRQRLPDGSMIAGKYRVLERLGGGGMGDVYRAEHTLAGRVVAFKLLREDFANDADLTRRFFQEAQAVNRIRHPNIVDVLDAGFSEHGPYVVMEILEGASVAKALARAGRLDVGAALAVIVPVLDALEAAHRQGIVHRDLKPENVFLARTAAGDVQVKILDFGIAKVMDAAEDGDARPRTHTGIIFGTPDYLSPEQASGDRVIDGRSDVFSVGTLLYELVTGKRPFQAKTAVATAYRVVHEQPARFADLGVEVDPLFQDALDLALAKRAEERFTSASGFADMLAPLVPDGATRKAALRALVELSKRDGEREEEKSKKEEVSAPPVLPDLSVKPLTTGPVSDPLPMAKTMASVGYDASSTPPPAVIAERPATPPPRRERALTPAGVRPITATALELPRSEPPRGPVTHTTLRAQRTSSIPVVAWTPRPLPAHAKGRCHVRGTFARAVSHWIARAFGDDAREEVLRRIPLEHADYFRGDAFNALVWYELEAVDLFVEASTAVLLAGDARDWKSLARDNFELDLGPVLKPTPRAVAPGALLMRSPAGWGRIFDFGVVRPTLEPARGAAGRALVRVDAFEATSMAIRWATIGTMEALLRAGGASEATSRITAGEASFARELEYELVWR